VDFEAVADAVEGVPYMTRAQGRWVHDHLRDSEARDALDLGTAHGVSAAYIASAGCRVVSVDWAGADWDPPPTAVLERAGVTDSVELVRDPSSSYVWWLKQQVEARSDDAGNCEPLFDFCYLDGAHNFAIDGIAVLLVERLLRPGGWLLLDDVDWSYDRDMGEAAIPYTQTEGVLHPLSEEERSVPHVRAVLELVVKPHPSFTELRLEDGRWAWARKAPGEPKRLELASRRSLRYMLSSALRRSG
jgi:predicted O-methyltransferase YrrM